MCEMTAGYTTLCGPKYQINSVGERWDYLRTPTRYETSGLRVAELGSLDERFDEDLCPAVAWAWHHPAVGSRVADELQVELLTADGVGGVICEPGYTFTAASTVGGGGVGAVSVSLDSWALHQAASTPAGTASSVAVIDSGDVASTNGTIIDLVNGVAQAIPPTDGFGHGTAVAQLIRDLRPAATVTAIRVLDNQGLAPSFQVMNGLIVALWSRDYEVVNASLVVQASGACATSLGKSIGYLVTLCQQHAGSLPTLVAAAGNHPQTLGYPATLPAATVAIALDWNGAPAPYNTSTAGTSVSVTSAYGGTAAQPFGTISQAGTPTDFFGTSAAAALVSASYLA